MNVVIALLLVTLGMGIDAIYQRKIRISECNAYETGYQQGLKENTIHKKITVPDVPGERKKPSMAAPVALPPTFEEKLRMHGRVMMQLK